MAKLAKDDLNFLKRMGVLNEQKKKIVNRYIEMESDLNSASNPYMEHVYNECREASKKYSDEKEGQTEALYNILQYLEVLRDKGVLNISLKKECDCDINDIFKELKILERK